MKFLVGKTFGRKKSLLLLVPFRYDGARRMIGGVLAVDLKKVDWYRIEWGILGYNLEVWIPWSDGDFEITIADLVEKNMLQ